MDIYIVITQFITPLVQMRLSSISVISTCTFTAISCASTLKFERKMQKSLLNNLNKFHNQQEMPKFSLKPRSSKEIHNFEKAKINDDLLGIVFEYLDVEDLDSMLQVNSEFFHISIFAMAAKLKKISPYFVFNYYWLNALFYTFFKENQLTKSIIKPDELELLTYKFIAWGEDSVEESKIPFNLKYFVLAFLNEIVYGPDAHMPLNLSEWKFNLLKRFNKYQYLKTFSLYQDALIDTAVSDRAEPVEFAQLCKAYAAMIYKRPSESKLNGLIQWSVPFSESYITAILEEIAAALIDLAHEKIEREEDLAVALEIMTFTNSFSQSFWDFIKDFDHHLYPYFEARADSKSYRWNKELVKKYLGDRINGLNYLLTRNSFNNTFDLQQLLSMNVDLPVLMKEFLYCATPSLTELEIFSQIVQAGLFPAELKEQVRNHESKMFSRILNSS